MKKFRLLFVLTVVVSMLVTTGCATSSNRLSMLSQEEDLSESTCFKGKTTKQVTQKLGKPQQKITNSKGNQIWEYKKPASKHTALNTFVRVSSLGLYSEEDAPYVDVLRLTFAKGIVTNQEYRENVLNFGLLGAEAKIDD